MIRFLQINLHRCGTARQLLDATAAEKGSDVLLISEPPRGPPDGPNRVTSRDGSCSVVLPGRSAIAAVSSGAGTGFAWIRTANLVAYSCYMSPNQTQDEFGESLDRLEDSIRQLSPGADVLVAGDFNAKSHEWGSTVEDDRGSGLADLAASLGLVAVNVGNKPTFRRLGTHSVIDVTFASALLAPKIQGWKVLDDFTDSDHNYIEFKVAPSPGRLANTASRLGRINPGERLGWACRKLDSTALIRYLRSTPTQGTAGDITADQAAEALDAHLAHAADASMPRRSYRPCTRKPAHWWSAEIALLRSRCLAARRAYQRSRGRRVAPEGMEDLRCVFQGERKALKLAIKKAQENSWKELCKAVDNDPWGLPYKLVTNKLRKSNPGALMGGSEVAIVDGLFPDHPPTDWTTVPLPSTGGEIGPRFTATELAVAARHLPSGKAPGPDGVPNAVVKLACAINPEAMLTVFNRCLELGEFPRLWKKAKLVLIHKGADKPPDEPSSYRPISLLSTVGKVYERLLLGRVNIHLMNVEGGLSDSQFGFRAGRSTVDALRAVLSVPDEVARVPARNRGICAVVSLDVRNAFNSAPWRRIDEALALKRIPHYLRAVLRSFMADRTMIVPGGAVRTVTAGVPQGSVLGPTLWNIFYDPLMAVPVPAGVRLIAFADDVAIVGTARTGELLEQALNPALEAVSAWMATNGLSLAIHKTEAAVLTRKWSYNPPRLRLGGADVQISDELKYLGVVLDRRLTFNSHVIRAAAAAIGTANAISRLMMNVGGPSAAKRRLLGSVVSSKLLYAATVWSGPSLDSERNKNRLNAPLRRTALRIIRGYRTVSDDAALVLAGLPPADLQARERARVHAREPAGDAQPTEPRSRRTAERVKTLEDWSTRWSQSPKAAWTRRIIPDLSRWLGRTVYFQLSFHSSQALTGHGCFKAYLHRMGRAADPWCEECLQAEDTAEHTLLDCPFWSDERVGLEAAVGGRRLRVGDITDMVCGPILADLPEDYPRRTMLLTSAQRLTDEFMNFIEKVLGRKEELERARQRR